MATFRYLSPSITICQYHFDNIDKALDVYCQYDKVVLVGDFNAQIGEKTCYKNPDKPRCIDFTLTNSPLSFYKSNFLFTGLSGCHKLEL